MWFQIHVAHCWFYRLCVRTEDESYEEQSQFEECSLWLPGLAGEGATWADRSVLEGSLPRGDHGTLRHPEKAALQTHGRSVFTLCTWWNTRFTGLNSTWKYGSRTQSWTQTWVSWANPDPGSNKYLLRVTENVNENTVTWGSNCQ